MNKQISLESYLAYRQANKQSRQAKPCEGCGRTISGNKELCWTCIQAFLAVGSTEEEPVDY